MSVHFALVFWNLHSEKSPAENEEKVDFGGWDEPRATTQSVGNITISMEMKNTPEPGPGKASKSDGSGDTTNR
ncbi:hypothetical protein TSAR_005982 [Trichomalopsis sarcophagae]|uniref:Uncharacterized protein n=1 Tax=Trichomalopsis sarcophagae TaxID=543379 RepID=A0A232FDH8_9HYME|nr:hypothetical protein TSAR_005982 [Trichomalopsis sarcophagae]